MIVDNESPIRRTATAEELLRFGEVSISGNIVVRYAANKSVIALLPAIVVSSCLTFIFSREFSG